MTKFKNPVNRYELSQKEDKVIIKFYNTNNEEEDFLELGIGSKPQKDTKWKKTLKSFDDIEYLNSWVKDIQQLIVDLYKPGS
ncbi:MAG: hypothetical protein MPJ22_13080, partial [Pirellulales bacterium]|nr:hypothetical protein [Pirellulales bacterium]